MSSFKRSLTLTNWQPLHRLADYHYQETPIYIVQTVDAGKDVLAIGFSLRNKKKDVAGRLCSLEEAADYIDLYVMRLLLERYGEL